MLNSKIAENDIRIAFSCPQDLPGAKPRILKIRAKVQAKPSLWTPLRQQPPRCFPGGLKIAQDSLNIAPR